MPSNCNYYFTHQTWPNAPWRGHIMTSVGIYSKQGLHTIIKFKVGAIFIHNEWNAAAAAAFRSNHAADWA